MVDGRRARTTKAKTKTRRQRTKDAEATARKIVDFIDDGREPGADLPGRNGYSADAVVARSVVATRLKAHGAIPSLPLTVLSSVTKVCVPGAGWIPADVGTVALFRGPGGAPMVTFRSDGEPITLHFNACALKEARRAELEDLDDSRTGAR